MLRDRFEQAKLRALATDKQLAVCILDLDDFKHINKAYNKEQGDQLLIDVANRIQHELTLNDTLSRQGGDQFLLLMTNIDDVEQFELRIRQLLYALTKPFSYSNVDISITASLGMSIFPEDNVDLDAMLRHADHALYLAKVAGKNRWKKFNTDNDKETIQKQNFLQEIRRGLASSSITNLK